MGGALHLQRFGVRIKSGAEVTVDNLVKLNETPLRRPKSTFTAPIAGPDPKRGASLSYAYQSLRHTSGKTC